jgi:hypothetical protein
MKSESLMIIPGTADYFRTTVSDFRTLYQIKGVSFNTFSLPEVHCVRLLIKNLGRLMPESIIRKELEALGIPVHAFLQLHSGRRDQDSAMNRSPTPLFVVSVARGPERQKVRFL